MSVPANAFARNVRTNLSLAIVSGNDLDQRTSITGRYRPFSPDMPATMKKPSSTLYRSAGFVLPFLLSAQVVAQVTSPAGVEQAAFRQTAPNTPPQRVRFERRLSKAGDVVEQEINLQMRMTTSIRQGNELTGQHRSNVTSRHQRVVTTLDVAGGRTNAVQVEYQLATRGMTDSEV